MTMIKLLVFFLLHAIWVVAQSPKANVTSQVVSTGASNNDPSGGSKTTSGAVQSSSSTIESLPSITPFQVPYDVLQGLGIPLNIPSVEQPGNIAWTAPAAPNALGSLGGLVGGAKGGRRAPPPTYGSIGFQAGLPYDRSV